MAFRGRCYGYQRARRAKELQDTADEGEVRQRALVLEREESCEYTKNVISTVEHLSAFICEDCGRPGRIRRGGWAKCRCDIHASGKAAR